MNELCPMPGCSIERITPDGPGFLHIAAHGARPGGRCPDCGRANRAVHSRYHRRPADLPSLGRSVGVELRVRRFYCRNAACARRGTVKLLLARIEKHRRPSALWPYVAALAPVTSAQIAKACARTARYSVAGR